MKKRIYQFIFCRMMDWKIIGQIDPHIKKCILIVIPHTSWHDFYIGLLARGIIGLDIHWVGKKEMFRFPFGYYFRWMGGVPLDRKGKLNAVDSIAAIFNIREVFRLGISPEGTRKKVTELRTGFYYIALKSQVPIIPVAFDYKKKEVRFAASYYPSGNYQADLLEILPFFENAVGKKPVYSFKV